MLVGDLYSVTPSGSAPVQPGPVIAYVCAPGPVVLFPGTSDVGPTIEHREKRITIAKIWKAQDIGFLGDIKESIGVESIGIRKRSRPRNDASG